MDYRLMPYSGCVAQRHSNHCGMATGVSKKASVFHNVMCLSITLTVLFIQMDELWSFLKNKKSQLWVFVGFEVDSRFWMNFELGSRTTHTATKLVTCINHYLGKLSRINAVKVTTDKLAAYKNALQSVFTEIDYVYLQIVKKRIKMRLVTDVTRKKILSTKDTKSTKK